MSKILVTGSTGLIGNKVIKFLKKKNHVFGLSKSLNFDLSDEKQVKEFFKKNNNFEYLINLHGSNDHVIKNKSNIKSKISNNKSDFDYYFNNNVFSFYLTNKYFIKYCKKGKGIINFASIYAMNSPKHYLFRKPKDIFYVSSKHSVIGLSKYFATKYGKRLNVNCIVNGGILDDQPLSFVNNLKKHIPKKRMMKVSDLYGIIELLCSDKSQYINGSPIIIDGGYSSW